MQHAGATADAKTKCSGTGRGAEKAWWVPRLVRADISVPPPDAALMVLAPGCAMSCSNPPVAVGPAFSSELRCRGKLVVLAAFSLSYRCGREVEKL